MFADPVADHPAAPGVPPAPRFFWRGVTVVATGLLLATATLLFAPIEGFDALERPEEALERLVGRELEVRAALRTSPAWERALYAAVLSSDDVAHEDAIRWYDELVVADASPLAELYRVVLLAETGRTGRARAAIDAWDVGDETAARYQAWARAAFGGDRPEPAVARAMVDAIGAELPRDWFSDRLVARLAVRAGDPARAVEADAAITARGLRLLHRYRLVLAVEALLLGLGLAAGVGAWRRRAALAVGTAPVPPPWSGVDGYGLFVRGALGLIAFGALPVLLPLSGAWRSGTLTLVSGVPLVACAAWLLRARGLSFATTFGLTPTRGAGSSLATASIVLVAVSAIGDVVIDSLAGRLGVRTHWTDGFLESLLWGTPAEVVAETIDTVLWAPLVEEILFRGVLYATLRIRMGPVPAAVVSAGVFALAHGYGAAGFAAVFLSGLLWALAYERTRSLLPGMIAHAASNLMATGVFLLTLRL